MYENTNTTMRRLAGHKEQGRFRQRLRHTSIVRDRKDVFVTEYEFVLCQDGKPTGLKAMMTRKAAQNKNTVYENKFYDKLSTDKNCKLLRWVHPGTLRSMEKNKAKHDYMKSVVGTKQFLEDLDNRSKSVRRKTLPVA